MDEITVDLLDESRRVRREFLIAIESHRGELFGYCRRLTGNVWDAEDLVQETLARAFARAAQSHHPIANPLGWLVRVATNAFIDADRRSTPLLAADLDAPADDAAEAADPVEVAEALEEVMTALPARERAALVLKDVFDYPLADIASRVGSSVGAVKAALHRARTKLAEPAPYAPRQAPDRPVLDAAVAAFNAYDADALTRIFLDDGEMSIVGMVHETGPAQVKEGSLRHTFDLEDDVRYVAEVREHAGDPVVVVWSHPKDGGPAGVSEVWRCVTADGRLVRIDDYFFCPEVVSEIAALWDLPTTLHGYRYE